MSGLADIITDHTGRRRTVLEYAHITGRLVTEAKKPGFGADDWAPLAALVDTAKFTRVGAFKEQMDWSEYVEFLTGWATTSEWECTFKRITEHNELVFLELEERSVVGDFRSVVNSLSVYAFSDDGRIRHLDLYLQMALPA
ncbi:hypothetical protein ACWDUN_16470 [Mycobacterium sp. NPDC003323]